MKKKLERLFENNGFQSTVKIILSGILSLFIGQALSKLVNEEWVFFLVFGIALIIFLGFTIILERFELKLNVTKIIDNDLKNKQWISVVRLAHPLSRPLWLAGKYDLRINLGRKVLKALISMDDDFVSIYDQSISVEELKARVYIDDLGWTIFRTNTYSTECIDNILRGIAIAKEENISSLMVKGYRHLVGIYDKINKDKLAIEYAQKAYEVINDLSNLQEYPHKKRDKDRVELDYASLKLKVEVSKKGHEKSTIEELNSFIAESERIKQYFLDKNDGDRYVKTFYLKAEILFLYDDREKTLAAEEVLQEGLTVSSNQAREDTYIRIAILLIELNNRKIKNEIDKIHRADLIKSNKEIFSIALKKAKVINNKEHILNLKELIQKCK